MKNSNFSILILFVVCILASNASSQCVECPQCDNKVAVGFLKKSQKKRNVYEVSVEEIAVPNICMPKPLFRLKAQLCKLFARKCYPGQPCGPCEIEDCPKRIREGHIRKIRVMKKSSVKCDRCSYKWEVADLQQVDEYLHGPVPEAEPASEQPSNEPAAPSPAADGESTNATTAGADSNANNNGSDQKESDLQLQPRLEPSHGQTQPIPSAEPAYEYHKKK